MHNTENETELHDITAVTNEEFAALKDKVDIITGGFPCTSFSLSGKRLGFEDENTGDLFFHIVRAAKEINPDYILLENVKGILSIDKGNTVKTIVNTLEHLGYNVEYGLFKSVKWGVPQIRERVFFLAVKKDKSKGQILQPLLDRQEHTTENVHLDAIVEKVVDERFYLKDDLSEKFKKDMLARGMLDEEYKNSDRFVVSCVGSTQKNAGRSDGGYSPTVTKAMGAGGGHIPMILTRESDRFRKLTPIETWRLQGFPDELFHKAQAVNSNTQLYIQAGNSVTVNVIEEIGKYFT